MSWPKGKKRSAATREKIAQANRRRWSDPEYKAHLSESQKRSWDDPEIAERRSASRRGQKRSSETKQKMSESQKKVDRSKPNMQKVRAMNAARRGSHNTEEQNEKIAAAKKQWHEDHPELSQELVTKATLANRYFDNKLELAFATILDDLGIKYEKQGCIGALQKPHRFHKWDFLIHEVKVAVELDGCYWHGCLEHHPDRVSAEMDRAELERDAEAQNECWIVLRFWEHDVRNDRVAIAAIVERAVERRRSVLDAA